MLRLVTFLSFCPSPPRGPKWPLQLDLMWQRRHSAWRTPRVEKMATNFALKTTLRAVFLCCQTAKRRRPLFLCVLFVQGQARTTFSARLAYPHRLCFLERKQVAHSLLRPTQIKFINGFVSHLFHPRPRLSKVAYVRKASFLSISI